MVHNRRAATKDAALDLGDLVSAIRIIELTAKSRPAAIRALVQAANLDDEGIAPEVVLNAIEEREAAAQTLVANDFAACVHRLDGDFRIVLGRSKSGVDYGGPAGLHVRLICLLVLGRKLLQTHVEILAAMAELLKSAEFRQQLIDAKDAKTIDALLLAKAGLTPEHRPVRPPSVPKLTQTLIKHAIQLVEAVGSQALLLAMDRVENVPWDLFSTWKGKLLVITTEQSDDFEIKRENTHVFDVLHATLSRMDRQTSGCCSQPLPGCSTKKPPSSA